MLTQSCVIVHDDGSERHRRTSLRQQTANCRHTTRSLRVFSELEAARTHLTPEFEMDRGTSGVRRGTDKLTV